MAYEVEVTATAAEAIVRLPRQDQSRVQRKIDALAEDPRPHGAVKLTGLRDAYRLRSGDYRIVYTIDDTIRVVSVRRVAHRREAYRRL
jgi:mRNA interferase RelE/StbE